MTADPAATIRRLAPRDAAAYRELMLQAYANEPEAWKASVSERAPLPMSFWEARLADGAEAPETVFGAFLDGRLVGAVGLRPDTRPQTDHKATLFGMTVVPDHRGKGIGRSLVEALLEHARSLPATRVVRLTVEQSNRSAQGLYVSCGFRPFGTEPFAFRVQERFLSQVHMWCDVRATR